MENNPLNTIMESLLAGEQEVAEQAINEWFASNLVEAEVEETEEVDEAEEVSESAGLVQEGPYSNRLPQQCALCGETDLAMSEDEEVCDQCKEEAAAANPDLMGESVDPELEALEEAFKLFTVSDKLQNQEGAQVGEADKVPVQTTSPVPNHKAADRVAGKGVEVKATEHKGYDQEKSPAVAQPTVKAENTDKDPKAVAKAGSGSALLNKKDSENTTSPISGAKRK